MAKVLHEQNKLADRFIAHMVPRNVRIEQDLIDQLFNSSEKRLARASCCWRATASRPSRGRSSPPSPRRPFRKWSARRAARQFLHE